MPLGRLAHQTSDTLETKRLKRKARTPSTFLPRCHVLGKSLGWTNKLKCSVQNWFIIQVAMIFVSIQFPTSWVGLCKGYVRQCWRTWGSNLWCSVWGMVRDFYPGSPIHQHYHHFYPQTTHQHVWDSTSRMSTSHCGQVNGITDPNVHLVSILRNSNLLKEVNPNCIFICPTAKDEQNQLVNSVSILSIKYPPENKVEEFIYRIEIKVIPDSYNYDAWKIRTI